MQLYPLPHQVELCFAFSGGNLSSNVDLADAYLHMEVYQESRNYLELLTHKGLFRYIRHPLGLHEAPAIF